MTKIRLDTQVKGNLPVNSLYNGDETIAGNKTFSGNVNINGNVGIGTTSPSEKLEVNGTIKSKYTGEFWSGTFHSSLNDGSRQWLYGIRGGTGSNRFAFQHYNGTDWLGDTLILEGEDVLTRKLSPQTDNAYTLGKSGNRWSSVWAANGTIQTSDKRTKTDITPTSLGLDFIDKLNPVSYKWIEGGNVITYEEVEVEKEVQEEIEVKYQEESIKLINGKYVKVIEEKTRREKVFKEVDLFDENGNVIGKHQVPKMVKKLVKEKKEVIKPTPGKRNHFGFIAQEVEEALDGTDFGGLVIDENGQYALRYDQFISPLVKAVKELKARVEFLENNK